MNISRSVGRAKKIIVIPAFKPCLLAKSFFKWATDGLIFIDQMFMGVNIKSFEKLQQEFNLSKGDFYKYLRVRHYYRIIKKDQICKEKLKMEEVLM